MRKCAEASSNHQNVILVSIAKVSEICTVVEKMISQSGLKLQRSQNVLLNDFCGVYGRNDSDPPS